MGRPKNGWFVKCINCGIDKYVNPSTKKGKYNFCSHKCQGIYNYKNEICKPPINRMFAKKNPRFISGKYKSNGYFILSNFGKRIPEHRYIIENNIGRKLLTNEVVHHKNGDKTDNRIENLEVMTRSEHKALRHPTRSNISMYDYCKTCGKWIHKDNKKQLCCSIKCGQIYRRKKSFYDKTTPN